MVGSNKSIEIIGFYSHLSSQFRHDGRYFIDLEDDERLPTYEDIASSDITKIEVIAAYPLNLKYTDCNTSALRPFLNALSGISGSGVNVVVIRNGEYLPFRKLYVTEIDDAGKTIQCELRFSLDFWLDMAGAMKLNTLPYDRIDFTYENIRSINENHWRFIDGAAGYVFPYINWGTTFLNKTLTVADLRPFLHALGVCRKGFKQMNMAFSCPVLETDIGRQWAAYVLKSDYGNTTANNDRRSLSVSLDTTIIVGDLGANAQQRLYNNIPFNTVRKDLDGSWQFNPVASFTDSTYYRIGGGFIGDIMWKSEMIVRTQVYYDQDFEVTNELWIEYPGNDEALMLYKEEFHTDKFIGNFPGIGTGCWSINFDVKLENMNIPPDSKLYVKLYYNLGHQDMMAFQGAVLDIDVKQSVYAEGDTIHLYDEISPDYTFLDFFKGIIHFICGRVYFNYKSNHVILFSAFEANYFGHDVEGYFKSQGYQLISIDDIVPDSQIIRQQTAIERYNLTLGFARSTDPAITSDKNLYGDKSQVFDSINIVGQQGEKADDREDRNPFFEPTINKPYPLYYHINNIDPALDRYPLDMPYMTDNEPLERGGPVRMSYNIKPRMLVIHGYANLRVKNDAGTLVVPGAIMNYNDGIPMYAYDYPNMFTLSGETLNRYLIYGVAENDLYKKFWKQYLDENRNNIPYNLLVYMKYGNSTKYDFRERILVDYQNIQYIARLTRKEDYDGGVSGLPTPIVLYPYRSLKQSRASDEEPLEIRTECDQSNLFIEITKVGNCYTATMGGSSSSAIIDTIFSYKYLGDLSWTIGDVLCDPTGDFVFRMQVVFADENCLDFYASRPVSPCQNEIQIVFTYDPIGGCLTIAYDPAFINSTVDVEEIIYQLDGGGDLTYSDPICSPDLDGIAIVTATISLTFEGGCDPLEMSGEFTFPPLNYNCALNVPTIGYQAIGNCQILPTFTGTIIEDIVIMDEISFRYDEDDEWQLWDGGTPLDKPVYLSRATVYEGCPSTLVFLHVT